MVYSLLLLLLMLSDEKLVFDVIALHVIHYPYFFLFLNNFLLLKFFSILYIFSTKPAWFFLLSFAVFLSFLLRIEGTPSSITLSLNYPLIIPSSNSFFFNWIEFLSEWILLQLNLITCNNISENVIYYLLYIILPVAICCKCMKNVYFKYYLRLILSTYF